ncbi:hypothetical protein MNBD_GAMMA11-3245 [hydrothermal vent metagenome]|uniref:DUF3857 domain-containing protein n=1 Tax=hydrothermal vent metagenome TaxID=652676 RepID=A0A3B0XRD8_9ZZZZ
MYFRLFLLFIALFSGVLTSLSAAKAAETVKKTAIENPIDKPTIDRHGPAPWIKYHEVRLPDALPLDEITGGSYYALVDNQIRVTEKNTEFYSHYAELVVNQQGLEQVSLVNIKFDPTYETPTLNTLRIRRGKKIIDKLNTAQISLLQQETELENLIYNGRLTANIILDDVRVGDIVEYSYTIKGTNPVYNNIFSYERFIEWSVPVHQQKVRMLWGKRAPLYVKKINSNIKITERKSGAFTEYSAETDDAKTRTVNNQLPRWYDPYGVIYFNEIKNWSDVARWSVPLYENAIGTSPQIRRISRDIRNKYSDQGQQIVQALKIVQGDIRYLGIETGVNSHKPTPAGQTLQRRYGDCKDKTVLFISLLKALNIQARPALVSTRRTAALAEQPASIDAFNHVLVKVWHNNEIFWIDPTRQYQNNKLKEVYQPDYRYALVVDPATVQLEKMNDSSANTRLEINEYFDLSKGGAKDVEFKVNSLYYGYNAENLRSQSADKGLKKIQDNYLEFYRFYYTSVEPVEKLVLLEEQSAEAIQQNEKYRLDKFWETDHKKEQYNASFYATSMLTSLPKPEQLKRNSPYEFQYPNNIKQTIKVLFKPGNWSFEGEEFTLDNAFFYYHYTSEYYPANNTLRLSYEFKSHTDHIPAKDIDAYMEARKRVRNLAEFPIVEYFQPGDSEQSDKTPPDSNEATTGTEIDSTDIMFYSAITLYSVALLYIIISWRIDARKQPAFENIAFYPVSLVKIFALSLVTFGLYSAYWFYKNWKYAKATDNSSIMPIARAIFDLFWYYPLYARLVKDSTIRHQKNKVLLKPLAILFAIAYFAASILSEADRIWLLTLILAPLLLFPLANYINHIDENDRAAYNYNSRWLARHTIIALLTLPLILLTLSSDLYILPSDRVVSGDKIAERDIKYMQRKGIFPAGEKIVYFYSDAFFSTRDDGNGFTENHVFSYWKDDESGFSFQSERLSQVKKIDVSPAKDSAENTIITIIREDDSQFLLYVSSEKKLDKTFTKELKARWKRSRSQ